MKERFETNRFRNMQKFTSQSYAKQRKLRTNSIFF